MKNLITYLKTLWSRVADSQRNDSRHDCRLTVVRPSFDRRDYQLKRVTRLAAMLCLLFTLGVGNAWGAHTAVPLGNMTSGEKYIITAIYSGTTYYLIPNSYAQGAAGSAGSYTTSLTDAAAWTFTKEASGWTISTVVNNTTYYLAHASTNNGVKTQTNKAYYTAAAYTTGATTVKLTSNSRVLSLYQGSNWRCYTTASGVQNIQLYKVSSFTITAQSNNNTYGTVSLSGNVITATPNSGYQVSTSTPYTVSPNNSATVSQNGNEFTVTPSANTTVTINFEAIPNYTVTFNAGSGTCGTSSFTQTAGNRSTTLPTATAPASCTGYSFAGWCTISAGNSDDNTTSPGTILKAGESYEPTSTHTLYAVYTKTEGGGGGSSWVETDFADLTSSDVFVLATPAGYALPSNGGNAKPVVSAITVSAGKITSTVTDGLKWNMSGNSTDGYTFYPNGTTSTWLCCTTTASSGTNDNIRINNSGSRKVWITDSDGDLKTKDTYTDRWLCCYNNADFRGYTASNVTSDIISKCYKYSSGTTYYMTNMTCESCTAPTGLATGTINSTSIQVTITDPANTGTYEIYYNQSGTAPTSGTGASATVNTTTPNITGLASGETYYMWVRAKCGESSKSDWVALTGSTFTTTCGDPSSTSNGATTHATTGGNGTQVLNWSGDPSNYEIYYHGSSTAPSPSQSPSRTVNGAKTETITGLTPGTYYWWVRSKCSSGKGDWVAGPSFTINGIKIGGTTPVAFGEVAQGSSVTPKTIKVSGIGLASGSNITASFPVGSPFSASPTSVAYNADKADLSISASTATVGDYDQYLTLSYNGGAYTATVKVTMTVVRSITYSINGVENTVLSADGATILSVLPASPASCDDTNYPTFYGWTTSPINGSTTTPPTIVTTEVVNATTAEETYYAVFAKGSQYWGRLTSSELSGLSAGTELVIVAVDQGYVLKNDLTCSSSVPAETDGKITPTDDIKWALAGSSGAWQLKSGTDILGTLYSNCPGSGNGLALNFNTYFQTYSIASSSHGTNEFYIKANDCTEGVLTKVSKYDNFRVVTTSSYSSAASAALKLYIKKGSYSEFITNCCNTPTLAFAASPYAVIRQDIQGASTTTWAEVDVTFTSNNTTGTISATTYTDSKTVYKMSSWQSRSTTDVSALCATGHAYFEVLTQPSGATPGTGKFRVKTTSGQTGQGTYRIAITQAATDAEHGNYCEATVYGFVDVTLRDKFVDKLNDNGTVNKDGHGAQLATPLLSELGTQVENACHSEGRKLKGWIKETDLKTLYENGTPASTRVQTIDGLCETCADGSDQTSLIVAPGTNVTMSGATWYAVWAYER